MTNNRIKTSLGEKSFTIFNYAFFFSLCLLMLYPFWHVIMLSFSSLEASIRGGAFFWPKGFNLDTYEAVFKNPLIYSGYLTSIIVTVIGTALGTLLTAMLAYPLSKKTLRGGRVISLLVLFTMIFGAGMIPNFLLIRTLGIFNTTAALILPGLISAYNCIIMRSFFLGLPASLEESARIDGATDLRIFFSIVLPLSKAVLATIALFLAVGYWNDFFSTILYITDTDKWSLQAVLRFMLTNTQEAMQQAGVNVVAQTNTTAETIKAAAIVISTIPILCVYPFVQKHFVKGVLIGGVKG